MWEAFEHAAFYGLDNLTAIIDVNRSASAARPMHGWDLDSYADRAKAFGWHAIEIDGHDVERDRPRPSARRPRSRSQPTVIVARTVKGKGVKEVEDKPGWHGKALDHPERGDRRARRRAQHRRRRGEAGARRAAHASTSTARSSCRPGSWARKSRRGGPTATRSRRSGDARGDVVALDGEVSNSTYAEIFRDAHPDRYFEMYIAEQQMVAAAVGLQVRGWVPFASTFAAFLSRAYDFIRMAAISQANIRLCGSHAGVSIGEDGPSQMALEDLAMMRAVHGSTVLYPSDANQTAKLVAEMADRDGIVYLRTTRAATPVVYGADEEFPVGGSRVLREGDDLAIVAAGITLHESLKAAEQLAGEGIEARVIDLYSVKPVDAETLRAAAEATGGRILTVEDHWSEGGIGDAVLEALSDGEAPARVVRLAVRDLPGSGKPAELLAAAGIDAEHIAEAARSLVGAAVGAARTGARYSSRCRSRAAA